jgi:hypothetical protein
VSPPRSSSDEDEDEEEKDEAGRLEGGGSSPVPGKGAGGAEMRANWERADAQPFFSFRNDVSMLLTMLD